MKKAFVAIIRFYQKYLSGLKRYPTCKFIPTCSEYAIEAILTHGVLRGTWLATKRLLRCSPFCKECGYDPVPPVKKK